MRRREDRNGPSSCHRRPPLPPLAPAAPIVDLWFAPIRAAAAAADAAVQAEDEADDRLIAHVVQRRESPLGYYYLWGRAVGTTKPRGKKVEAKEKTRGHAQKTFENHSRFHKLY